MSYEFKFPDVGEGITEGKLVSWTVKVGDTITVDQTIAEVETDKSVVEIPSPVAGTVEKLVYEAGALMEVGKPMMTISEGGETPAAVVEKPTEEVAKVVEEAPSQKPIAQKTTPVVNTQPTKNKTVLAMPSVRAYAKSHTLDLTTVQASGKHGQILITDIEGAAHTQVAQHSDNKVAPVEPQPAAPTKTATVVSHSENVLATPAVRKQAREMGIDIGTITGSGRNGQVTSEDLKKPTQLVVAQAVAETTVQQVAPVAGSQPFSKVRSVVASRMIESLQKTAQVTFSDEADVSKFVELRAKQKEALSKQGVKLTFLPLFIKAVVQTLKDFPTFNALLGADGKSLDIHSEYNIGFAADTPKGLFVPVIADADKKSVLELAKEVVDLATKARDAKLGKQTQSTFTISSVGNLGGLMFTPILNFPEVGILGIGKISKRAVVVNGEIVIRDMLILSLTFDHQANDGADAARFVQRLIMYLEDPNKLLVVL
ncbi:MAG: pyruvate dehydrogenase E2 component (dihydrolipoamide acetyltransferase) [Candidatus Woesearchaeota archaeon]|jgi:pyruvate dehydrogenase E2 component (dihydrolipoamide acetyltransferase)